MDEKTQETLCKKLARLILDYQESYDSADFHFYQGFMYCMKSLGYYVEMTFNIDCITDGFVCNGKRYLLEDYKVK